MPLVRRAVRVVFLALMDDARPDPGPAAAVRTVECPGCFCLVRAGRLAEHRTLCHRGPVPPVRPTLDLIDDAGDVPPAPALIPDAGGA